MEILTDVDGVLLNWEDSFHAWMSRQGHQIDHKNSYEICECYSSLSKERVNELISIFNSSANMGFLPPLADAVHVVRRLYEIHGVVFHCITSMGDDPFARILREQNLKRIFGNAIHQVTILGCGADKTESLKPYKNSNMVWLEDNIHNANVGVELGLNTFLFKRTYNKPKGEHEGFTRVDDWTSLLNKLLTSNIL